MATLNSALYTAQAQSGAVGFGSRASGSAVSAMLLIMTATYTCTGSEADGDLINVGILPEGSVVVPDQCRISTDGTGGTGSAISKLGDAGDDDRYSATSVAVASAASTAVTTVNGQAVTPVGVPLGYETIIATYALSSGNTTAGKKITFRIAYTSTV